MIDYSCFQNPEEEYRSAPFWSLNDELIKDELIRQIHEMFEQGIGGFFLHPRGGMKTKYLSKEYFEAIRACIDEAEKLGMKAWLYDEDRFPSGSAAGLVVKENPEFAIKALVFSKGELSQLENSIEVLKMPGQMLLDGQSYTDLCCKEAVDSFIQITHDKYKNEFGKQFGQCIPGIFTDEPSFSVNLEGKSVLPWSRDYEAEFLKIKGYNISEFFKDLFLPTEKSKKVRFDYWDVLVRLFVNSFTKNIYNWCEQNGMLFTGHFWEHEFPSPLNNGSVMPSYEFMHYPGIDMLFNNDNKEQFGNDLIVKEVSSIGNQLAKDRIISESYGASGWELSFADQKRIADWQFALGINFICQHLFHYSLEGYRKRDFALSFFDQPWWNHYKLLGDYVGRLSYVLSKGKFVGDILVMHSSSSIWSEHQVDGENIEVEKIGDSLQWVTNTLNQLHFLYDIGDDIIMEKHATIDKNYLKIGDMSYTTVIIPRLSLIRNSSFQLLKLFAHNGGRIIAIDQLPNLLDGLKDDQLEQFFCSDNIIKINSDIAELKMAVVTAGNEGFEITTINGEDVPEIYCTKRKTETNHTCFLCNTSKINKYNTLLAIDDAYNVEEWDAVTGKKHLKEVIEKDNKYYIQLEFNQVQSHLLLVDNNRKVLPVSFLRMEQECVEQIELSSWKVIRKDYNSYTLKVCKYRVNGSDWSQEIDVIDVDGAVGSNAGFGWRGIFSKQPWMYSEAECKVKVKVDVEFKFNVTEELTGNLFAASEVPEEFELFINGIKCEPNGQTYQNRAFKMHNIAKHIVCGENKITLVNKQYSVKSGVESVYLVGDFKLQKQNDIFVLQNEDKIIPIGDWTQLGYPYYSGTMEYMTKFELEKKHPGKVEIKLGKLWMVAAQLFVNGYPVKVFGWEPYEADISEYVILGENVVSIQVMNSLQNLLGSHNDVETPGFSTPGSFSYANGDVRFVSSGFDGKGYIKLC